MMRNMPEPATPPSDPGAAAVAYEATPNPEPDSTAAAPANTVDPRAPEEKAERVRFKEAIPGM
eukprot:9622002-Karenia_brevis.AAC.1